MSIKKLVLCIIVLFSGYSLVFGAEKIISVATLADYPPYCFLKENHKADKNPIQPGMDSTKLQGFSWDVLRECFHIMGYSIKLEIHPWARVEKKVKRKQVDLIFPAVLNKEREKIFYFPQETVDNANFLIYVLKDFSIKWEGLKNLKNLRLGAMRGWSYGDKWNDCNHVKKVNIDKIIHGFRMLKNKRLDGFVGYEINFDYALKQTNMKSLFKKLPSFDSTSEYVIGLKTKRVHQLLKDYDLGKKKIIENGKYDQIINKWK